jgi:hypothetical protein
VILSLGLPFAAIGSFPSSLDAMHRVRVGAATTSLAPFLLPDPTVAVDAVPRGTSLMGIIAISGSSWSLRLGVRDANVFLHPDYLAFPGGADIECAYLATLPGDSLLATHEVIATLRESSRCTALLDLTAASPVESSRAVPTDATQWMLVPRRS